MPWICQVLLCQFLGEGVLPALAHAALVGILQGAEEMARGNTAVTQICLNVPIRPNSRELMMTAVTVEQSKPSPTCSPSSPLSYTGKEVITLTEILSGPDHVLLTPPDYNNK